MRKILIVIGVLLLSINYVAAQSSEYVTYKDTNRVDNYNHLYVSLYGGLAQFYGDVSSDIFFPGSMMKGKIPWSFSPRVGWDFNPRFGLRTDLNVNSIWAKNNKGQDIYFHANIIDWQGIFSMNLTNVVFPYIYNKKWNMTIFAGAGFMWYRSIARNSNDDILHVVGYDNNANKIKREHERLWSAGFSGAYKFTKHFDLGLEVKFNNTPTDKIDGVDRVLSEFDNYSSVMLGLTYHIGTHEQEWKWNPIDPFLGDIMDSVAAHDDEIVDLGNQVEALKYCCEKGGPKEPDTDLDSVPDSKDLEPNTPKGNLVNWQGVTIPIDTTPANPNTGGPGPAVGGGISGQAMFFNSIYFPFDKSVITQESYREIVKVAQYINAHPGVKIMISGNCDVRGSNEYNVALSQRRVKAAKKVLMEDFGFKAENFAEEALSEDHPISNTTHWVNRRVDFFIVH